MAFGAGAQGRGGLQGSAGIWGFSSGRRIQCHTAGLHFARAVSQRAPGGGGSRWGGGGVTFWGWCHTAGVVSRCGEPHGAGGAFGISHLALGIPRFAPRFAHTAGLRDTHHRQHPARAEGNVCPCSCCLAERLHCPVLIPNPSWAPPPPSTLREGGAERFKGMSKQRGLAGTQLWSPLAGSVWCNLLLHPGRGSAGHGLLPFQVWGGIGTIWAYRTPTPPACRAALGAALGAALWGLGSDP